MEKIAKSSLSANRQTPSGRRVRRTPQARAEQILQEAEKLLKQDPQCFADVVRKLSAKADALTGKNHPLAFLVGSNAHDPFLPDLILPAGVYVSETE